MVCYFFNAPSNWRPLDILERLFGALSLNFERSSFCSPRRVFSKIYKIFFSRKFSSSAESTMLVGAATSDAYSCYLIEARAACILF
jgi:hypothetical protein